MRSSSASRRAPSDHRELADEPERPCVHRRRADRAGQLAVERDLYIISDDCYDALVFEPHKFREHRRAGAGVHRADDHRHSFSKTYAMTGWRLGYSVAPKLLYQGMYRVSSQCNRNPASFTQMAGLTALRGPQDVVTNMVAEYKRRRDLVLAGLEETGLPCVSPEGTFYFIIDCARFGLSSVEMAAHPASRHLSVTPGLYFGKGGDNYIRISFAASDEDLRRGRPDCVKPSRRCRSRCSLQGSAGAVGCATDAEPRGPFEEALVCPSGRVLMERPKRFGLAAATALLSRHPGGVRERRARAGRKQPELGDKGRAKIRRRHDGDGRARRRGSDARPEHHQTRPG